MQELLAAFPKSETAGPALVGAPVLHDTPDAGPGTVEAQTGFDATTAGAATVEGPASYHAPDGAGWIAIKGIIFDVHSEEPRVDLEALWRQFASGETIDWNRFEGTFALAAWDARHRRGIALNDQTSQLNCYYTEDAEFAYVTTSALPLARKLGRGLDPAAVREFIARGALVAPSAMFEGFKRFDIGEHLIIENGAARIGKHWTYPVDIQNWSFDRAAEEAAGVLADRIGRYGRSGGRIVADLTSGYDSRLLSSAADHAGLSPDVTVNGTPEEQEVRIALKVADATGWPMHFFDRRELWTREIDPDMRSELTLRTDGTLPFTEVYHHLLTRPALAEEFRMHAAGVGGEFIRYHPWGQEFFGIGHRRRANVDRLLKYRMLHDGPPPGDLFDTNWYPHFRHDLFDRVDAICRDMPDTLTTQQLDAIHVWKQTGHPSLYLSAQFNWLPATVPSMGAGFVTAGMQTPWRFRLTARLTRRVTHLLCPRAAAVVTQYGGTAGPVTLSNFHQHASQPFRRTGHLFRKLDRVLLGKTTGRHGKHGPPLRRPWLTGEFRDFLALPAMRSRTLYAAEGLARLLSGTDDDWHSREKWILRVATIEQLCHELDYTPESGFFQS